MSQAEAEDDEPLTLGDRLQIVAWKLQDATEDLNDAIRRIEQVFREKGLTPAQVEIPTFEEKTIGPFTRKVSGHSLLWDGNRLVYGNGQHRVNLLSASRAMRVRAVNVIPALFPRAVVYGGPGDNPKEP